MVRKNEFSAINVCYSSFFCVLIMSFDIAGPLPPKVGSGSAEHTRLNERCAMEMVVDNIVIKYM
jgi:hypothetical protein